MLLLTILIQINGKMILKQERRINMTCFLCKGNTVKSTTSYMTQYNDCFIIIKNVPCTKCTQCGEEYLNGVTLQKTESIIKSVKSILTEVAIVDYTKAA